eukprot:284697_1
MKRFANWEPQQTNLTITDTLCEAITDALASHSETPCLGIIHTFCLEIAAHIDLPVDVVLSIVVAVAQWTLNRATIEDVLLGVTEATFDYTANVAEAGGQ